MTIPTHDGTAFTAPVDIILMTPDALFMKRRQKGDRDFAGQLFFVASGTLASLAFIPVGKNIEIMVANPALENDFMQIMVEYHRAFTVSAEFLAFKVHDSFIGFLFLGPSH